MLRAAANDALSSLAMRSSKLVSVASGIVSGDRFLVANQN